MMGNTVCHYVLPLQNSMIIRQLAQHADIPKRVAEEANRILGTRPPSVEALRTMPYTFAVVKEALRCMQLYLLVPHAQQLPADCWV